MRRSSASIRPKPTSNTYGLPIAIMHASSSLLWAACTKPHRHARPSAPPAAKLPPNRKNQTSFPIYISYQAPFAFLAFGWMGPRTDCR